MNYSYVILTDQFPTTEYKLDDRYILRIIKAAPEMFEGTSLKEEKNNALLAFQHIDNESFSIYKDLIIFHSFISGNVFTYIFAETAAEACFHDSKLVFLRRITANDFPDADIVDYNTFPVDTSDNPDDEFKYQPVNYQKAFRLFKDLQYGEKTRNLYNQIRLFVFAMALQDINKIYTNTYMTLSFYVTILESIIGKPPECNEPLICSKCGTKIAKHHTKSLERHFKEHYPMLHRKSRKIRHATYHEAVYYDLIQSIVDHDLDGQWLDDTLKEQAKEVGDFEIALDFQVHKELTKSFLSLYQEQTIK
ncbi:hypothetical protein ES708_30415 [subsurface metagenome]